MLIGELAKATGVRSETLRFYEARGLIASRRRSNGYREYPDEAAEAVRYIRVARDFGFSLAELVESLPKVRGADRASAIRVMLERKANAIDARIAELNAVRERLHDSLSGGCRLSTP